MAVDFDFLTTKQKKVYVAIETYIKSKGIPPTVREIGEMVGEKTPGAVQGILNRLEKKAVIKRQLGAARSVQLMSDSQHTQPIYLPKIKKICQRNIDNLLDIYNVDKLQPVSPDLLPPGGDCFMIDCPDNSMAKSGISYEDILVICRNCQLQDNDIILVLYENHVLLRHYFRNEESITLKADSNLLDREVFSMDEVKVIGKLVGKFTMY